MARRTLNYLTTEIADHTSVVAKSSRLVQPPSAVDIFSALISSENFQKHGSSGSNPIRTHADLPRFKLPSAGPDSLPTEILLLIFRFAFETCIDWRKSGTYYPYHTTVWLEDDPLSPSLFPYAPASVSVRWRHILSSVAVYWTRQVITVDPYMTSPVTIRTLLQWVGDLPLQFIVTRHPGIPGDTSTNEYARVQTVLDLLRPHIHHTWSLTFNVEHTSSLPALWREEGNARYLGVLMLMSSSSDALPQSSELYPASYGTENGTSLQAHRLREITLTGRLFENTPAFWELRNWCRTVTSLTISGYTTSDGSGLPLSKFVSMMQACKFLKRLTVEDIAFDNDISHPFLLEAPIVFLRNLTDVKALEIIISRGLGHRVKELVAISDCPIEGFEERNLFRKIVFCTSLVLEGISSRTGIDELIRIWNGENLSLINCPGVTGSFLETVDVLDMPIDLRCLHIVDCEHIAVENLIDLVQVRLDVQVGLDNPDDDLYATLIELHVRGRGPPISVQQATWFAEHVGSFCWNTLARDGVRYFWDASVRELIVSLTDI